MVKIICHSSQCLPQRLSRHSKIKQQLHCAHTKSGSDRVFPLWSLCDDADVHLNESTWENTPIDRKDKATEVTSMMT